MNSSIQNAYSIGNVSVVGGNGGNGGGARWYSALGGDGGNGGNAFSGGLLGAFSNSLNHTYAAGSVAATAGIGGNAGGGPGGSGVPGVNGTAYEGGLVGDSISLTVSTANFWDTLTSGISDPVGRGASSGMFDEETSWYMVGAAAALGALFGTMKADDPKFSVRLRWEPSDYDRR